MYNNITHIQKEEKIKELRIELSQKNKNLLEGNSRGKNDKLFREIKQIKNKIIEIKKIRVKKWVECPECKHSWKSGAIGTIDNKQRIKCSECGNQFYFKHNNTMGHKLKILKEDIKLAKNNLIPYPDFSRINIILNKYDILFYDLMYILDIPESVIEKYRKQL
jgi:transposase-like protein